MDQNLQLFKRRECDTSLKRKKIKKLVYEALEHAYKKHGRKKWGRHEFHSILLEEVDELWEEIKTDAPHDKVLHEATQVAAMIFRYLERGDRYGH